MNNFKLRATAAALAGVALLGLNGVAKADSTDDLLKKLRDKGILTEQEFNEFNNTRDIEQEQSAKEKSALNKGKIKIGSFIDNATFYGDIRARYEMRDGEDTQAVPLSEDRNRGRYKLTFGVKTEANNFFYSDLAFAMGGKGRSDNATFGGSNTVGENNKEALYVKRAMIGWHGVDWLSVEAGRVANPLYTTPMVWDGDLTMEGLVEKLEYTVGGVDLFANLVQAEYLGDQINFNKGGNVGNGTDKANNFLLAFQGGAKFKLTDQLSGKAALTYTTYTHDQSAVTAKRIFQPARGNGTGLGTNPLAINDVRPIEIPFELNYKANSKYTVSAFGDYVHNLDGSDRKDAACAALAAGADKTAVCNAGSDSDAWMLGVGIKSGKGAAGDWDAKIWWQEVGMYSVDPNTVDSDFMDSRVNMKGVVFKAGYNVEENVVLNFAAGHASRKDKSLAAVGSGNDLGLNVDDYNLYQIDLTYKF
jgi:hypothetical protein